jgi:6-phosphogluconolactonase
VFGHAAPAQAPPVAFLSRGRPGTGREPLTEPDPGARRIRWHAMPDGATLAAAAHQRIQAAADAAIRARGQFHIVLAGGNTPRAAYQRLREVRADWAAWHIYFGDERCLPRDDPARNSRMAEEAWLDHVAIPALQRPPIPAELGAAAAARAYGASLQSVAAFDLVLLGLGEDGHTASLFPGHDWGAAPGSPAALAIFDAPKPPRERVSLSAARLSDAREVLFMVSGASKREALAQWRAGAAIPASAIVPAAGVDVLVAA